MWKEKSRKIGEDIKGYKFVKIMLYINKCIFEV